MNITPKTAEIAQAKTIAAMDTLERELTPSGYLVGDRFTVTDLTAAALLSPMAWPPEFPYQDGFSIAPEPYLKARESLLAHRALRWTLEMYRRHRGQSAEVRPGADVSAA